MSARTTEVPAKSSIRYRCRNDTVLIRMERVEQVGKVFMPEASIQGYRYRVAAIGPKVEGLKPGDVVIVTGQVGVDIGPLPTDSKLYLTREQNVALVLEATSQLPSPKGDGL